MTVKIEDMFGNAAYEFVDLIKADPLVSEASFEVKKEVPEVPTQGPEVPKDMTFKTSELTKRMGKNANKIKNNPNHPINRVQKPNIRREERLVDKILGELEEATPRPKATQRGKISKAEAQKRQAREDRKRAAQERRDDRAKAGIDALIGSDADRKYAKQKRMERGIDENRFASHGGKDTDAGSAYAKPSKGGSMKGVYTLKGKDGKPLFDKREKSNESTEIEEKLSTQYKDKTKLGQSSERKSLGRGSSIKDGSKKTGYESPKEFRDASMSLRKHRERFGDLAKEEVTINEKAPKYDKQGLDKFDRSKRMIRHMQDKYGPAKSGFGPDSKFRTGKDHSVANEKKAKIKEEVTIDERVRLEADNGNLLMVVAAWKGKSYQLTMFFPQPSMPTREEVESEIQKVYPGSRLMSYRITRRGEGQPIMQVVNSHSKNYLLNNGNIGEDVVNNAVNYFIYEGINEDGLEIFIEELGVENFVEFVHDLVEDSELIESYALTGKKKSPKRLPKGTQPAKTTKATIARGDSKIKAAAPSGAFKKRPAAKKAVETAKEKQPEKKPVRDAIARGIFRAVDAYKKGMERHNAAMKTAKKAGKVAGAIAKGAGEGVKTAGKAVKMAHAVATKEEVEITEDKREEKARRAELAKKHGIDLTKPGARAKLIRLMSADTKSKNRKAKGDTRTDKEVRKDRADDRKAFDRQRKDMEYRGKSKDEIKKNMKKMRDEVRSVNDPVNAPPSREKVRAKVGTKVDKPADAPKTGRNKPTAEKRADRKSYEAQQRRNAKEQQNEDWQKVNKGDKTDGMSKKAVAAYRRENPGSKLKTAVTGKVKKGSKDAKRRKSFCARSKGQQDMHNIDCSKTPDKPVCKARRRWKC